MHLAGALECTKGKLKASCAQRAQGIWSPARDGSSVAQGVSPGYKNKNNQSPERSEWAAGTEA